MARCLVTGGCGFIGSHLSNSLLADGHSVRVLDDLSTGKKSNVSGNIDLRVGSATNPFTVESALDGMDGCIHLAAISSISEVNANWRHAHDVNQNGLLNILEAARTMPRQPIPVVYASSAAIYGNYLGKPRIETDAPTPLSRYGADKVSCEIHARVASMTYGIPTIDVRLFNVYGPMQNPETPACGAVVKIANKLRKHQTIEMFGDGTQVRDFIYVLDATRFLTEAMYRINLEGRLGGIVNACSGHVTSVADLIRQLSQYLNVEPMVSYQPARADEIHTSIGNPDYSIATLCVLAEVDLASGIRKTMRQSNRPLSSWLDSPKQMS